MSERKVGEVKVVLIESLHESDLDGDEGLPACLKLYEDLDRDGTFQVFAKGDQWTGDRVGDLVVLRCTDEIAQNSPKYSDCGIPYFYWEEVDDVALPG